MHGRIKHLHRKLDISMQSVGMYTRSSCNSITRGVGALGLRGAKHEYDMLPRSITDE